jgi:hypothetical protein
MALTERDKLLLNTWKRTILIKVCGTVTGQRVWRTRTNQELRELYKTSDLTADRKFAVTGAQI